MVRFVIVCDTTIIFNFYFLLRRLYKSQLDCGNITSDLRNWILDITFSGIKWSWREGKREMQTLTPAPWILVSG